MKRNSIYFNYRSNYNDLHVECILIRLFIRLLLQILSFAYSNIFFNQPKSSINNDARPKNVKNSPQSKVRLGYEKHKRLGRKNRDRIHKHIQT